MKYLSALTAAALIATGGWALAQSHHGHSQKVSAQETAATKAYRAANDKMHAGMNFRFTGDADVDFIKGMIPHHQGAIDMAKVQVKYGKDAETRKLAEQIIADQEKEIAQMKAWLRKNAK